MLRVRIDINGYEIIHITAKRLEAIAKWNTYAWTYKQHDPQRYQEGEIRHKYSKGALQLLRVILFEILTKRRKKYWRNQR